MKIKNSIIFVLVFALLILGVACEKKHEEHSLVEVAAVAATCTTDGNIHYYKCSECNKIFADENATEEITGEVVIKATGHKLVHVDGIAANCETEGSLERYVCERCNRSFSDEQGLNELDSYVIAPLGHILKKVEAVEADCGTMSNGNVEYYVCIHNCSKRFVPVAESASDAKLIETENGEKIYVAERQPEELIVFAEHEYQGNVCIKCHHVQNASSVGLEYELSADESYYLVSGMGTCSDTTVFIGGEYNGKPVKEIKPEAFKGISGIEAVVFIAGATNGEYVEKIGSGAFKDCVSLKNVYFSGGSDEKGDIYGIKEIGTETFFGCDGLTITYEGSSQEWSKVHKATDFGEENVVFKSIEVEINF